MKNYYRLMLGAQSVHAEECFSGEPVSGGRIHEMPKYPRWNTPSLQ